MAISVRKISSFPLFSMQSFANRDYSALIFNYEKAHRISKFSIKPFRTISIRYLSVFLLNLKLTIMFNWKYIFVCTNLFWSALICFASCGSHFSFGYFRKCVARFEILVYDYYGLWLCKLWFALFFRYFRKCVARSEKLVYDYYGLWLGKPSPGQKLRIPDTAFNFSKAFKYKFNLFVDKNIAGKD